MLHIVDTLKGYYLPTDANDAGKKFDDWEIMCDLSPNYDDDEHYDGGQHRP